MERMHGAPADCFSRSSSSYAFLCFPYCLMSSLVNLQDLFTYALRCNSGRQGKREDQDKHPYRSVHVEPSSIFAPSGNLYAPIKRSPARVSTAPNSPMIRQRSAFFLFTPQPPVYRMTVTSHPTRAAGISAKTMPGKSIPLRWNHFW